MDIAKLQTDPSFGEQVRTGLADRLSVAAPKAFGCAVQVRVDLDVDMTYPDRFRVLFDWAGEVFFYTVLDYGAVGMNKRQMIPRYAAGRTEPLNASLREWKERVKFGTPDRIRRY